MRHHKVIFALPKWDLNGVSVFSADLAGALQDAGRPAEIVLTEDSSLNGSFPRPRDVPVKSLPAAPYDNWFSRWQAMIRYLEENAPCIYIPNHDLRNSCVSSRLSNSVAIVGVLSVDLGTEHDHAKRLGKYWNKIVAVSESIRRNVSRICPSLDSRIVTIHNGARVPNEFPKRQDSSVLRLIYHGAIREKQKRVFDLLHITTGALKRGIDVQLTIIGDGIAKPQLEAAARDLTKENRVRFLPTLTHEQVLTHLSQQDIFLLTSEYEGLSISLLEAMASGCIPVVSNVAGNPEVVESGVNGYLHNVGDIDGFIGSLQELSSNKDQRRRMSLAAYETVVQHFSFQPMVQNYLNLFDEVEEQTNRQSFFRPRGKMTPPPAQVDGVKIQPLDTRAEVKKVNAALLWPNFVVAQPTRSDRAQKSRIISSPESHRTTDLRVIFASGSGKVGGPEIFSSNLVRSLQNQGITAEIVRTSESKDGQKLPEDILVEDLTTEQNTEWRARWRAMIEFLEKRAPCIYIPNQDWRHSCVLPRLSSNVKTLAVVHSDEPQDYEHVIRLSHYWDGVVVVSKAIEAEVLRLDHSLRERIHLIPYGVEIPADHASRPDRKEGEPLRVLYSGRLVQDQNRIIDLVEILEILHKRHVAVELTIAGNGPDQEWMMERSIQLSLARRIRFLGALPGKYLHQVMSESDVFILTSAFEGLPLSLLEAMAYGCVPVVSNVRSGIPELVKDGINGFCVEVADAALFADRLEQLQKDQRLRASLSKQAYQTVRNGGYDFQTAEEKYSKVFQQLFTQNYSRPRGNILPRPDLAAKESGNILRRFRRRSKRLFSQLRFKLLPN